MRPTLLNVGRKIKSFFVRDTAQALAVVETTTHELTRTVDGYVVPVRKTIFKRFPVAFALLVTLGVSATVLGIEQVLLRYELLANHPELILFFGITILVFTGTLYKKLG
jgi:hypothetical protein